MRPNDVFQGLCSIWDFVDSSPLGCVPEERDFLQPEPTPHRQPSQSFWYQPAGYDMTISRQKMFSAVKMQYRCLILKADKLFPLRKIIYELQHTFCSSSLVLSSISWCATFTFLRFIDFSMRKLEEITNKNNNQSKDKSVIKESTIWLKNEAAIVILKPFKSVS